eukprot:1000-Heterococcus_DN1.PRE.3
MQALDITTASHPVYYLALATPVATRKHTLRQIYVNNDKITDNGLQQALFITVRVVISVYVSIKLLTSTVANFHIIACTAELLLHSMLTYNCTANVCSSALSCMPV